MSRKLPGANDCVVVREYGNHNAYSKLCFHIQSKRP